MFTFLRLKNFKSFKSIYLDLRKNQKQAKPFIALYGENGSGKTNLLSAFDLLMKSFTSFSNQEMLESFSKYQPDSESDFFEELKAMLDNLRFSECMKSARMIGCDENTEVEYGFLIGEVEGTYKIVFNEALVSEELYYLIEKRRGILFKIALDNGKIEKNIHKSVFLSKKLEDEVVIEIDKYWGKHSFFGIFMKKFQALNEEFIKKGVSPTLLDVFLNFTNSNLIIKSSEHHEEGYVARDDKFGLANLVSGIISEEMMDRLEKSRYIIDYYIRFIHSDVKQVFYKTEASGDKIKYQLYFKKLIGGKVREIPFSLESTGTKRMPQIIRAILAAVDGKTVIFDEIDTGVHDMLMENIITSAQDYIKRQMIITTHNTMLLEKLDPSSVYVIYMDADANKEIRCLTDYDYRIRESNNVRDLYIKGIFGGVPFSDYIDFSSFAEEEEA